MIETGGRVNFTAFLLVIASALLLRGGGAAEYIVGDSFGWGVPPANDRGFYDEWTANKTFQAGDTFVFNWNRRQNVTHTVTERTKEEYDSCNTTRAVDIVIDGLKMTQLKNGTFYYICTVDNHCQRGQKIKLVIGNGINGATVLVPARAFAVAALSALALSFY